MILCIEFLLGYFFLWFILFSVVQKPLFILYNRQGHRGVITKNTLRQIYRHGYRSDFIACACLTIIPLLVCWLHLHAPFFHIRMVMTVVNVLLTALVAVVVVRDMVAFRAGEKGYKNVDYIVILLLFIVLFIVVDGYSRLVLTENDTILPKPIIWHIVAIVLFGAMLGVSFLIIRGEGLRPYSPGAFSFSNSAYLNHCALNPVYNFLYGLTYLSDRGRLSDR